MPKGSVNKVILVGNAGRDAEVRYTGSGQPYARFSIATSESYKDKNGEWQDRTDWHDIVAWGKLAEYVGDNVTKGAKVYVEGSLRSRHVESNGEKRTFREVQAASVIVLDGADASAQRGRELADGEVLF